MGLPSRVERRYSASAASFLVAVGLVSLAGSAQTAASAKEVHLAVQVRTEQGDAIGGLKPRDFIVLAADSASSTPLSAEVGTAIPRNARTPATVPTRLLVVLLTGRRGLRTSLPSKLGMAWNSGWQVSVEDTHGALTAYASTAAQLQTAIAKSSSAHCALQCAMRDLMRFPGRRIVFLVTDKRSPVNPTSMQLALLQGVTVYHVGGDPSKQEISFGGYLDFSVPIPNTPDPGGLQSVIGGVESQVERERGWETEDGSFRSAMLDAVEDAKGFYDLKLQIPSEVDGLTLQVRVQGTSGAKCSIFAEPYAIGASPPSLTIVNGRQ